MLGTGFPDGSYRRIWTNETTMYVNLFSLFGEFARLLQGGECYVCITGCYNDVIGEPSASFRRIDEHYLGNIHPRSEYFKALASNDFVPINVVDLKPQTIPYWELRARSPVRTSIDGSFLTAYREGSFHYLLIVADRGPRAL
jgi:geranyl diphosphate 2-C-methyltransferase